MSCICHSQGHQNKTCFTHFQKRSPKQSIVRFMSNTFSALSSYENAAAVDELLESKTGIQNTEDSFGVLAQRNTVVNSFTCPFQLRLPSNHGWSSDAAFELQDA